MNLPAKKLGIDEGLAVRDKLGHEVIELALNQNKWHIIQENCLDFDLENQFVQEYKHDKFKYFSDPITAILGPSVQDQIQIKFNDSIQKNETISKITTWARNISGTGRIMDSITLIADELFTNAVFNALPYYVGLPKGIDRREKVNLTDKKVCQFFAGHNEHRLILGCTDSFGSLNTQKLLKLIQSTYVKGIAGSINYSSAGAEVGCRLMFDKCINFYAGVWLHEKTTIALGLPIGPKSRAVDLNLKNLHLMEIRE